MKDYVCILTNGLKRAFFPVLVALPGVLHAQTTPEIYIQTLSRSQLAAGASYEVKDDKFKNSSINWNTITNLSVNDVITFEIRQDTDLYYYNKPFTATANVKIEYYTDPNQQSPTVLDNVELKVRFDTSAGTPYPGVAMFKFKGAYRVKVTVNSISSAELGTPLPAIFRLKSEIFIERKYQFSGTNADVTYYSLNNRKLSIHWNPANYPGAEEYDLEWRPVDDSSLEAASIRSRFTSGALITIPDDTLAGWFHHHGTRITTSAFGYTLNLPYNSGYLLYRVRGVQTDVNGVRQTTSWCYRALQGTDTGSAAVPIEGMDDSLNWQYTGTFAEEGKRKEVVSFFDGTLRNRESVTLNNSENKSVVGQTIYDVMGRPAVNVLPVPSTDSLLQFYPSFNRNAAGSAPYNYTDLGQGSSCDIDAQTMSTSSGASQYYSADNPFPKTNTYFFNKYIPDANGYPFSVTAYTADNTGRITRQGGVGDVFQLGGGHETKYFYGKPQQSELDRMFGSEAGNAQHFLKNMVIDPNGQASVSYVDANGKTVATALAGTSSAGLHALPGATDAAVADTEDMIEADNLVYNTADYSITAASSFTVPVNGDYNFTYQIDPLSLNTAYGPDKTLQICSDCYYDLDITVTDNCGQVVHTESRDAGNVFDTLCAPPPITGDFSLANLIPGSYNIAYKLKISKAALDFYDSRFVRVNTDLKTLADFTRQQLKEADFGGCFADCETCKATLGTKSEFTARFTSLFADYDIAYDGDYQLWVSHLYDSLYAQCEAMACVEDTSPCNNNYQMMLQDVTPGGQYAPYDSAYNLLEPQINVLQYYTTTVFTDENGLLDSVPDSHGNLVPPSKLPLSQFIRDFKSSWADSLVTHHPEYCFYKWCLANSASESFDEMVRNDLTGAAAARAAGLYNSDDFLALFHADPFFQSTGIGYSLAGEMQDSMTYYSKTIGLPYDSGAALPADLYVATRDPDISEYEASHSINFEEGFSSLANDTFKAVIIPGSQYKHGGYYDMLGVAGWMATCGQAGMPLDSCVTCQSCTNDDLVWNMYKAFYLQLKSRMYQAAMAASDNPYFQNCKNCYIGTDGLQGLLSKSGEADKLIKKWPVLRTLLADNYAVTHPARGPNAAGYFDVSMQAYADLVKGHYGSHQVLPSGEENDAFTVPAISATPAHFSQASGLVRVQTDQTCPYYPQYPSCYDASDFTLNYVPESRQYFAVFSSSLGATVGPTVHLAVGVAGGSLPDFELVIQAGSPASNTYTLPDNYPSDRHPVIMCAACEIPSGCTDGTYTDGNGDDYYISQSSDYPSDVPSGYGNCTQLSEFTGTGPGGQSCTFGDVWACPYSPTPPPTTSPSYCPDDPSAPLYAGKRRVYTDNIDVGALVDSLLHTDTTTLKQQGVARYDSLNRASSTYAADVWMARLSRCTADTSLLGQIRRGLVAVCLKATDSAHPEGASTLPPGVTATADGRTYSSFDDVILQVLGMSAVNDSCTSDLLASPYPYDKQAHTSDVGVIKTDSSICARLTELQNDWQSSGSAGTFQQFLQQHLGGDYQLSESQLTELEQSCTSCHYLLKETLTLPGALTDTAGPLHCSDVEASLGEIAAKYPALTQDNPFYETIVTNYLNHKYRYSLGYEDYQNFIDSLCPFDNQADLYNQAASQPVALDTNSCVAEKFSIAVTNAAIAYQAYIDSVHRDFREGFLTKCMNVQPRLTMTDSLLEYHYTLYYYDQAGNLVKTVPPAGVRLLSRAAMDSVLLYRKYGRKDCYLYSNYYNVNPPADSIAFFQLDSADRFHTGSAPFTLEMWVKLNDMGDQGLASDFYHSGTDNGIDDAGFSLSLYQGKLNFYLFGGISLLTYPDPFHPGDTIHSAFQLGYIRMASDDISPYLQTRKWNHIVVERTGATSAAMYVNGIPVAYSVIDESPFTSGGSVDPASAAPLRIGEGLNQNNQSIGMSDSAAIKQFRLYRRALSYSEIRQNAFSTCLTPSDPAALTVWAPLNDTVINDLAAGVTGEKVGNPAWFSLNQTLRPIYPRHVLATYYSYNSLNEVVSQRSPDGGTTRHWYDRLGRLAASQNSEQRHPVNGGSAGRYSYSKYDPLGRIIEVGEKSGAPDISTINTLDSAALASWMASGVDSQVIFTVYDNPALDNQDITPYQTNLRKRVAGAFYSDDGILSDYDASTRYSYDIEGNVKTLWQDIPGLESLDPTTGLKRIDYDYDIISGKVNKVSYQQGKGDQFFYKYDYDADNRVIAASTSRDGLLWHNDASYRYYLHGPLARMELGSRKVQGVDYAYTLQGWLKGINGNGTAPYATTGTDMAADGHSTSIYAPFARDVYGISLGYYTGDYAPIGGQDAGAFPLTYTAPSSLDNTGNQLFNGNISTSTVTLSSLEGGLPAGYSYGYDQLNRLVHTRWNEFYSGEGGWDNTRIKPSYQEDVSYDGNGNILRYFRNGTSTGHPLAMDSLSYYYNPGTNQLNHIHDNVGANNYYTDIDNQSPGNYGYDSIGNLIRITSDGYTDIGWTVYGKVSKERGATFNGNFGYDAAGKRILKEGQTGSIGGQQYYIRDAQGNILATYNYESSTLIWGEQDLYGTSRIGVWRWNKAIPAQPMLPQSETDTLSDWYEPGGRDYELTNHLGNVLSVITDKKIGVSLDDSTVDHYRAEVLSQNDYYPFGMEEPGRSRSIVNGLNVYPYAFNGKRMENIELYTSNIYDYGMRMYDARVGRFFSVDPLTGKYPELSPYQFASNRPIDGIDRDGLEWEVTKDKKGNINIGVNVNLRITDKLLSKGQINAYKKAIGAQLNRTLRESFGNSYSGWVTFKGGDQDRIHQLIPTLSIGSFVDRAIGGETVKGNSDVNIFNRDGTIKTPEQLANAAVHELLHTLRIEHPFEKTQGEDLRLIQTGGNSYITTRSTDPNIDYNIMNYSMISINGKRLGDLWKSKKPDLLTNDQLNLMIHEINLQGQGYGIMPKYNRALSPSKNNRIYLKYYRNYWLNTPGTLVKHQ